MARREDDLKRILEAGVAGAALIALSPLLAVLALLVRATSPGPALFAQARVGRGERRFLLYKFRSMVANAAAIGPWGTAPGDARITPLGRFLRKTSLDELPQLWNVVKGDMSLVGPRPDVPQQMDGYTPEERRERHSVPPGLTGWAQVNGRKALDAERRRELDLEYVRRRSLGFDLRILLRTAAQLVLKRSY